MENRYPLFPGGRILKKESLWDLRDYAYGGWQLQYVDYTNGILKGCRVRVEGTNLIVGRGMLKYGDFIYLVREEVMIPFEAENRMTILKAVFDVKKNHSDYFVYGVRFFLDNELKLQENQIELCRFHLREGSVLRDTYKNFYDMGTEYDTINLLYATVAGKEKTVLHPEIMQRFMEELHEQQDKQMADYAFCYSIKNTDGIVSRNLIAAYLADRKQDYTVKEINSWDNVRLFNELANVLKTQTNTGNAYLNKMIYVE